MSFILKGTEVSFDVSVDDDDDEVREVDAPASWGMLHDPSGRYWPSNSVLVMPFRRSGKPTDGNTKSKAYHGRNYEEHLGDVDPPPRRLGGWRFVGDVEEIWYRRWGSRHGGVMFRHPMNGVWWATLFKGEGHARLYRRPGAFRLDLSKGAMLDDRGYVWP